MDCLHYQENERPSSKELCQRLAGLKETREYRESVEQVERVLIDIVELERQMREMQVNEAATVQQLCDENQQLHDELREQKIQVQSLLWQEILLKNAQLAQKEQQIQQLNQKFEEYEQVLAKIHQTNNSLRQQVEQCQQQLSHQESTKPSQLPSPVAQVRGGQLQPDHSMKEKQPQSSLQQVHPQEEPHSPMKLVILGEWKDWGRAPYEMARGAAVVDGNVAYFMSRDGQICSYESSTQKWSELTRCPHSDSSLAVIRGLLTAIGGRKSGAVNELLSIQYIEWVEHFPPMPTKRSNTAAVTTKQHLIVAGGESGHKLSTVEVMDIQTLVWSTAASLPHHYSGASATICGDQLYMLGGLDMSGAKVKSVLTSSLTKLLQSCYEFSSDSVWHRIADVPVYRSSCAAVNGELVAIGGLDAEGKNRSAIHQYNPTTDSWDIISNMPTARYRCLVAVLSTNEMMMVGGNIWRFLSTDKVEMATFYLHVIE